MDWTKTAAVLGFLGVGLGAFGAHGLRGRIPEVLLASYNTGVLYHLVHALALLALALYSRATGASVAWPGWCFLVGILLFSGSLYAMAFTGWTRLGIITPLGGLAMLAGWLCTGWALRAADSAL